MRSLPTRLGTGRMPLIAVLYLRCQVGLLSRYKQIEALEIELLKSAVLIMKDVFYTAEV